jgi:hypothetical protein
VVLIGWQHYKKSGVLVHFLLDLFKKQALINPDKVPVLEKWNGDDIGYHNSMYATWCENLIDLWYFLKKSYKSV